MRVQGCSSRNAWRLGAVAAITIAAILLLAWPIVNPPPTLWAEILMPTVPEAYELWDESTGCWRAPVPADSFAVPITLDPGPHPASRAVYVH